MSQSELMPFLVRESKDERIENNRKLAEAFYTIHQRDKAWACMERAWIMSNGNPALLDRYVRMSASLGKFTSIRQAYKRAGMHAADNGNLGKALDHFYSSWNCVAQYTQVDDYEYDYDIINRIDRYLVKDRYHTYLKQNMGEPRKIRLAYLQYGMLQENSVIVKVMKDIIQHHDRDRFEVGIFIPESKKRIAMHKQAMDAIKAFQACGCEVFINCSSDHGDIVYEMAKQIYQFQADILLTSALFGGMQHYAISALCPAPVQIGFQFGPPQQFSYHNQDWGIAAVLDIQATSLSDCSYFELQTEVIDRATLPDQHEGLRIPQDAFVIVTAGREMKFNDERFWNMMADVLSHNENIYFMAIGIQQIRPHIQAHLDSDYGGRMKVVGWVEDYLSYLNMGSVYVDTYPSGGGVTIMDAMNLHIPVLSFKNDYVRLYTQADWSLAEEIVGVGDLLVDRGDFEGMKKNIIDLFHDPDRCHTIGEDCFVRIREKRGNPKSMTQTCEQIYTDVWEAKREKGALSYHEGDARAPLKGIGKNYTFALDQVGHVGRLARSVRNKIKGK